MDPHLTHFSPPPLVPSPLSPSVTAATSVAKALGVSTVGAQALKLFQEHPIFSEVISDQEAVAAIEKFVGRYPGPPDPDPGAQCPPLGACAQGFQSCPTPPHHGSVPVPSAIIPSQELGQSIQRRKLDSHNDRDSNSVFNKCSELPGSHAEE